MRFLDSSCDHDKKTQHPTKPLNQKPNRGVVGGGVEQSKKENKEGEKKKPKK